MAGTTCLPALDARDAMVRPDAPGAARSVLGLYCIEFPTGIHNDADRAARSLENEEVGGLAGSQDILCDAQDFEGNVGEPGHMWLFGPARRSVRKFSSDSRQAKGTSGVELRLVL